jgi:hypothetical protein
MIKEAIAIPTPIPSLVLVLIPFPGDVCPTCSMFAVGASVEAVGDEGVVNAVKDAEADANIEEGLEVDLVVDTDFEEACVVDVDTFASAVVTAKVVRLSVAEIGV